MKKNVAVKPRFWLHFPFHSQNKKQYSLTHSPPHHCTLSRNRGPHCAAITGSQERSLRLKASTAGGTSWHESVMIHTQIVWLGRAEQRLVSHGERQTLKNSTDIPRSAKFLHLPYLHSSNITNAHWWLISLNKHHLWAQRRALGVKCKCNQQWCPQEGGRNLRDLVSPERTLTLLYCHITNQSGPALHPSRILTDSSLLLAAAPSELSSLWCLCLLPIIQSDSVLPSYPLSFRFSSPYHSIQTSPSPSHTLPPFLKS